MCKSNVARSKHVRACGLSLIISCVCVGCMRTREWMCVSVSVRVSVIDE